MVCGRVLHFVLAWISQPGAEFEAVGVSGWLIFHQSARKGEIHGLQEDYAHSAYYEEAWAKDRYGAATPSVQA